ncbi:histidine kinase [Asanoa sp. NPDC049573]|uniref:sensor histidine kinase n=1 Tax=Asanoa sp. NPDC049573 TaxID=3155396 RepID=UPI003427E1A9
MQRWTPRRGDMVAAAVFTVGTQAEVWAGAVAGSPRPLLAATCLVGTVATAWHRIAPMAVLVIVLTALAVAPGALGADANAGFAWFVAALAVIVSAAYHARRPVVALAVTLGLLTGTVVLETGPVIADIAYACLLGTGGWLAGRTIASRTLRAELSEQRAALAEQEAQWRAGAAVIDERLRIARELHDVIGHSISVMTLHVGGVRRLLGPEHSEQRAALEAVERTGRETLAEVQRLLGVLRGFQLDDSVPAPGLAGAADLLEPARAAGICAQLTVSGDVRPLPAGLDLAAYRIVQEAVTNVLRHAAASRIDCSIEYGPAALELLVVDDGTTRGGTGRDGHGHIGMRERAALYGGTINLGPRAGGGYAVHVVLPISQPVMARADQGPP